MVYNIENQLSSGHGRRKKNQFPKRRDFILYFNILSGRWTKSRRQLVLNNPIVCYRIKYEIRCHFT